MNLMNKFKTYFEDLGIFNFEAMIKRNKNVQGFLDLVLPRPLSGVLATT